MERIKVYTHYDTNHEPIATVLPKVDGRGRLYITERTYRNLLKKRTIGGLAGIYASSDDYIYIKGRDGNYTGTI